MKDKKTKPVWELWGIELFDKVWSSTGLNSEQTRLIVDALKPTKKVLDIGTGIGNIAKKLVDNGKTVYGIDIDRRNLAYAEAKINNSKFVPTELDANRIDYEGEFDGVSCASNLGYFGDLKNLINRIYTASRPSSGLFAISGLEASEMRRFGQISGEELQTALKEGKLALSREELSRITESLKSVDLMASLDQQIDSSERTKNALSEAGFKILRDEKFYQDTAYFILAQKP